jgi:hypothetical protein
MGKWQSSARQGTFVDSRELNDMSTNKMRCISGGLLGKTCDAQRADFALVLGNPRRIGDWMCMCGNCIEFNRDVGSCRACHNHYCKSGTEVKAA